VCFFLALAILYQDPPIIVEQEEHYRCHKEVSPNKDSVVKQSK
jgi:hypothetical protein